MASPGSEQVRGREPGPRLSELLDDLLFPRLFRAVGLALRPERVFIALFMVVLIELFSRIPGMWLGEAGRLDWEGRLGGAWAGGGANWRAWEVLATYWAQGWGLWQAYPWSMAFVKLLSLIVIAVGGCMIARMAACDFSRGVIIGIGEAQAFAWKRFGSLLFAVLGPVALAGIIAAGLAVAAWVLLSVPYVNVVGGGLYFLLLMGGAVIVVVLAAYALGFPLLIPAVACEGSDGIDAIGRAYPYVLSRPLRFVGYALLAAAIGWVAIGVAFTATAAVNSVTETAASSLLGDKAAAIFDRPGAMAGEVAGGGQTARRVVAFWTGLVSMLAVAYAMSFLFCASTILYLLMRRVCDGQDVAELWMPGMVEGTMAESMRGRAEVSGVKIEAAALSVEKNTDE